MTVKIQEISNSIYGIGRGFNVVTWVSHKQFFSL